MRDLTKGSPMKLIISFFLPLLFGMLFQQFYNMMDAIIVGRFLGAKALAAVGGTGSINFMVIGFCMGVCNGFAIPVAQRFGAGDESMLRRYVINSVWLSAFFAAIMTVVVCLLCHRILIWMDTPADIMHASYDYIFIIFLGIPVVYLYNLLSGIIRSLGDSKTPLYFLILSSIINIILDIFTIRVLGMGVGGAAWATVIAQGVSGILCLLYMIRKFPILRLQRGEWRMNGNCIRRLCAMGIPMGLQYSITAIGSVILQTSVNTLGSTAVASVTAANKINMVFWCPFDAMGSTMATYAGQNLGAKKLNRVSQGVRACAFIALIYSIFAFGILFLFGESMNLIFLDVAEVEIIQNSTKFIRWCAAFFFPLSLVNIIRFTIQGLGFGKIAIFAGVSEMIARSLAGVLFVPVFGFTAVCIANPAAWIMADLFLIPAYVVVMKYLKKLMVNV